MKTIIFNSDVLLHEGLVTGRLRRSLQALLRAAAQNGYRVVVPETSLLELQKQQGELLEKVLKRLGDAADILRDYLGDLALPSVESRIRAYDILNLIKSCGVVPEVVRPTLEDFQDAHRRACLHEHPMPLGKRADEMRDLVIWAIAVRIAGSEGGAVLVSRDAVHVGSEGGEEAMRVGLHRVETDEAALELVGAETPAGRLVRRLIAVAWPALRERGLPLAPDPTIREVEPQSFLQGLEGPDRITTRASLGTSRGDSLEATLVFDLTHKALRGVRVHDIQALSGLALPSEIGLELEPAIDVSDALG